MKKFDRKKLIQYLEEIEHWDSNMHQMDREDMELALSEQYFPGMWPENRAVPMQTRHFRNKENKWFRHFYRTKPDLFAIQKNYLYLKANPVARFAMGRDQGN